MKLWFVLGTAIFISVGLSHSASAEEKSCPVDEHWVRAHHRRAYFKSDGTFVSATNVSAHCQGNPPGFSFWRNMLKTGMPQHWSHHLEKPKSWKDEERERVFEALSSLPPELWESTIKGIFRLGRSQDFPNPSSWGSGNIALYDSAFEETRNLARILAHELAHQKYSVSSQTALDYRRATEWGIRMNEKTSLIEITKRANGYVTEHAKENAEEDFATNVEFLLFDSEKLKSNAPQAYNWLRKHFGDTFKVRKGGL